jgi:hypothetical protein
MYLINAPMLLPKEWFGNKRHNLISSVLLLVAVFFNIVVVSKAGTEVNFPAIEIVRNSVGFDCNFGEVPANGGRNEPICISSRPQVVLIRDGTVRDIDGNSIICGLGSIVATTTDGVTFTNVCNTGTDEPFVSHRIPQDFITGIKVMPDGGWLLALGCDSAADQQGNLFRSADKGHTWTWIKQFERGFPMGTEWYAVADNEAAIGEYGYRFQTNSPRRVYYTDDYGATWTKIYEPNANQQHVHLVAFAPHDSNKIYVGYGDGTSAITIKLEYTPGVGGKKNPDNWSEANNSPIYSRDSANSSCAFSDGNYIYWGRDGSSSEPVVWRLSPNNDLREIVLNWPQYVNNFDSPYRTGNPNGEVRSMFLYNGIYYVPVTAIPGSLQKVGGIYVSTDAQHWVCAYRTESAMGFNCIAGYANGYIWGTYWESSGANELFKMTPIEANTVSAIRCERGVTNIFNNPDDSSFESSIGGWQLQLDIDPNNSGRTTEESLHGNGSFKVVCANKSQGLTRVQSSIWANMGGNPQVGDYICASFWIKGALSWPDKYTSYADISVVNGGQISFQQASFNVDRDWTKITIWGKCTSAITGYVQLRIFFDDNGYTGNFSNATCYIDCVQVNYTDNLHHSGSWQLGGVSRANEYAYQNITGLGKEFKTTFEWRPEIASREWHGGRISIASWTDDVDYIDLYYDVDSSKFVASDGWNTVTTVNNYSWEHLDSIKFSLANEIGDFNLSVESPLIGREQIVSSGTLLGRPVEVKFGTDSSGTGYGTGLIADVHHFDEWTGAPEPNQPGDLTGDGVVNFRDFAVFAVRWLELGCGEPDWCQGADLDKNGVVDFSDLYIFAKNWLKI